MIPKLSLLALPLVHVCAPTSVGRSSDHTLCRAATAAPSRSNGRQLIISASFAVLLSDIHFAPPSTDAFLTVDWYWPLNLVSLGIGCRERINNQFPDGKKEHRYRAWHWFVGLLPDNVLVRMVVVKILTIRLSLIYLDILLPPVSLTWSLWWSYMR